LTDTTENKVDLSQFLDVFFQESVEGLSTMETGLLRLLSKPAGLPLDHETINDIFRAAHSIKGGSGTFGFQDITQLTHSLEAILDQMREGIFPPTGAAIEVLLRAVDCTRELIAARLEGRTPNTSLVPAMCEQLTALLSGPPPKVDLQGHNQAKETNHPDLRISFHPVREFFHSASDPLFFLRELSDLGRINSVMDLSRLPSLRNLDTADCFLGWEITLSHVSCPIAEVQEVFAWADGRCELEIAPAGAIAEILALQMPPARSVPNEVARLPDNTRSSKDHSSIRVSTDKVDAVVNLVGELVITQSMLTCIGEDFQPHQLTKLREGLAQLTRNTRELQETVLKMRMLPISNLFDRFPRLIHDLNRKLNKSVQLKVSGGSTELDRTVLEKLSDPLVHLIRNSMDHGIERAEVRREVGKPDQGVITLHAEHRGGNVVIEISDDGAGLNQKRIQARAIERGLVQKTDVLTEAEINALIFAPGFSTADEVTEVSGRGVGMDVVKRNIEELSGQIHLTTKPGIGTSITVQLPLTLSILDGQLARTRDQRFVVPLVSIIESVQVPKASLRTIGDQTELYKWRDEYLRVIDLSRLFHVPGDHSGGDKRLLIIVEAHGNRVALLVDDLLAQQQVVIKSLETNFRKVQGVAGATILGDGIVAMILDVAEIVEMSKCVAAA
jgi:two-component system chemotaxis sensor kinase CheA